MNILNILIVSMLGTYEACAYDKDGHPSLRTGEGAVVGKEGRGSERRSLKQDFLEAEPYYDHSDVPLDIYKDKAPFTGKIVSTKRIVGPQASVETCHVIIDHSGDFPYFEGQSLGVIPPGTREKDGKPHAVRLYSIASSRYGDDLAGNTLSLCVSRVVDGISSNFLCDTNPGDEVTMTGPHSKNMLLDEVNPATDYIMIATNTGIAPFRGFVRRLFFEDTPAANAYTGKAWVLFDVENNDALLYEDEFQDAQARFPQNFQFYYALRSEGISIADLVGLLANEIFDKLENGAHIYFSGMKEMMPGIEEKLAAVCESKGIRYDKWVKDLKKNQQWHVEVYAL